MKLHEKKKSTERTRMLFIDANRTQSHAICELPPYDNTQGIDPDENNSIKVLKKDDSKQCYFVEFDLDYPHVLRGKALVSFLAEPEIKTVS